MEESCHIPSKHLPLRLSISCSVKLALDMMLEENHSTLGLSDRVHVTQSTWIFRTGRFGRQIHLFGPRCLRYPGTIYKAVELTKASLLLLPVVVSRLKEWETLLTAHPAIDNPIPDNYGSNYKPDPLCLISRADLEPAADERASSYGRRSLIYTQNSKLNIT